MLVALAVTIGAVIAKLVHTGRRKAQAEKARLAEEACHQARRSLNAVWAMDDR